MKKILLTLLFLGLLIGSALAAVNDFYSWEYWHNKTGLTGTTNDIISQYLSSLGYTGSINEQLHNYLVDETGLPASASNAELIENYFSGEVQGNPLTNYILTQTGDTITTESGDQIIQE